MTARPEAVQAWLAGRISAQVALARLVLAGMTADEIGDILPAGSELAALHRRHRSGLAGLAAMLREGEVDHASGGLEDIRRSFERAVRAAPEASVAAYCLGDPRLLARATDELVAWLRGEGLVGPGTDALDVGCGIGRVTAALAPLLGSITGIDVATGMIDEARRRHGHLSNVRFEVTDGISLAAAGHSLDLILFVDSMPYLVQAGVAETAVGQAACALRPGGSLAVLNLCYDGDAGRLAADWAERFDLSLATSGERPFRLWDGRAFVFRTPR